MSRVLYQFYAVHVTYFQHAEIVLTPIDSFAGTAIFNSTDIKSFQTDVDEG